MNASVIYNPNSLDNSRRYYAFGNVRDIGNIVGEIRISTTPLPHSDIIYKQLTDGSYQPTLAQRIDINYDLLNKLRSKSDDYTGRLSISLTVPRTLDMFDLKDENKKKDEQKYIELTKAVYQLLLEAINVDTRMNKQIEAKKQLREFSGSDF